MYGIYFDSAPKYFRGYFSRVSDTHDQRTRASDHSVNTLRFRTLVGKNTFAYSGTVAWNNLQASLKSICSVNHFKVALKKWLLSGLER